MIGFGGPATIDSSVTHGGGTANSADSDLWIGANPETSTDREWEGGIDDVAQWQRVLSNEEIQAIYSAGRQGIPLAKVIPEPSCALLLATCVFCLTFRDRRLPALSR